SPDTVAFPVGTTSSFTVTTLGSPAPGLTEFGTLPSGVGFVDNGDGTATLSGTPDTGMEGVYHLVITASNGVNPDYRQNFTLLVANVITVTALADETVSNGLVSLREAIQAATTQTSVDGSAAGTGTDLIVFAPNLSFAGPATASLTTIGDGT